jgi:hypothetical protein
VVAAEAGADWAAAGRAAAAVGAVGRAAVAVGAVAGVVVAEEEGASVRVGTVKAKVVAAVGMGSPCPLEREAGIQVVVGRVGGWARVVEVAEVVQVAAEPAMEPLEMDSSAAVGLGAAGPQGREVAAWVEVEPVVVARVVGALVAAATEVAEMGRVDMAMAMAAAAAVQEHWLGHEAGALAEEGTAAVVVMDAVAMGKAAVAMARLAAAWAPVTVEVVWARAAVEMAAVAKVGVVQAEAVPAVAVMEVAAQEEVAAEVGAQEVVATEPESSVVEAWVAAGSGWESSAVEATALVAVGGMVGAAVA